MDQLMSFWVKLESRTCLALQALCDAGESDATNKLGMRWFVDVSNIYTA